MGGSFFCFFFYSVPEKNSGFYGPKLTPPGKNLFCAFYREESTPAEKEKAAVPSPADEEAFFYQHSYLIKEKTLFEAPLVLQNPELPRGCEIASLAMLLQHAGVVVDKMTLAEEIEKQPFTYRGEDGRLYYGNPYCGFVGSIYTLSEPGYGVYIPPLRRLMEKYLPGKSIDLTGCDFQDILIFLSEEIPVLVIVNTTYAPLKPVEFQIWETEQGPLEITYRQHAVLLTGFDEDFVYFNDPLYEIKNKKSDREAFKAAWIQMGRQAISYLPY